MSIELDHLFSLVPRKALEADRLVEIELTEGEPNTHPGQGTACRRFFFRNAYLEEFGKFLGTVRGGLRAGGIDHAIARTDQPFEIFLGHYLTRRQALIG